MAELIKAKKLRVAAKGWVTRSVTQASKVLDQDAKPAAPLEIDQLDELIQEFNARLASLQEAQTSVELNLVEKDIEKDIITEAEFIERAQKVRSQLLQLRKSLTRGDGADSATATSTNVRLPKLNLPKFSGKTEQWLPFWETFVATVDSQDIPVVTKFSYLQSCLTGEAKRAISGLVLSKNNYAHACEVIKNRFGKREKIVFAHIQGLLNLKQAGDDVQRLRQLQDSLQSHIRSLQSLEVQGGFSVFLTPLVLSKLPEAMRVQWSRSDISEKETDIESLLKFLDGEITNMEMSRNFVIQGEQQRSSERNPRRIFKTASATALHLAAQSPAGAARTRPAAGGRPRCCFCSGGHNSGSCRELLKLEMQDRREAVQKAGLCFVCLSPGHVAKYCRKQCSVCTGKHSDIFCFQAQSSKQSVASDSSEARAPKAQQPVAQNASLSCTERKPCETSRVMLPTAKVNVQGLKGVVSARLVLDSGSQTTFVSEKLIKQVGAEFLGTKRVCYTAFGGAKSDDERGVYRLVVSGANLSRPTTHSFPAVQVPLICPPLSRHCVPSDLLQDLAGLELADALDGDDRLTVDILCGLDVFWSLVRPGAALVSDGFALLESVFGWVLSGVVNSDQPAGETNLVCSQLLTLGESTVRSFWELETIGIVPDEERVENHPVLRDLDQSVQFNRDTGRYQVKFPGSQMFRTFSRFMVKV